MKKTIIRSLTSCSLILVVLVSVAVPVFARDFNTSNYIVNTTTNENGIDRVSINIPAQAFTKPYWTFRKTDYTILQSGTGASFTCTFTPPDRRIIEFRPFGNPRTDFIDLTEVPNGTDLYVDINIDTADEYTAPSLRYIVRYFDEDKNQLSQTTTEFTVRELDNAQVTFTLNKPDRTKYCTFILELWDFQPPSGVTGSVPYTFTFSGVKFIFSISALQQLQQSTGKTNSILELIQDQMEEQNEQLSGIKDGINDTNQKLDEVINGTVEPRPPEGSDVVGDINDVEGGIVNDISGGFDEGEKSIKEAISLVQQYQGAFMAVAFVFNVFADIPIFTALLYIALALGIFAALLGVLFDYTGMRVASAKRTEQARIRREAAQSRKTKGK